MALYLNKGEIKIAIPVVFKSSNSYTSTFTLDLSNYKPLVGVICTDLVVPSGKDLELSYIDNCNQESGTYEITITSNNKAYTGNLDAIFKYYSKKPNIEIVQDTGAAHIEMHIGDLDEQYIESSFNGKIEIKNRSHTETEARTIYRVLENAQEDIVILDRTIELGSAMSYYFYANNNLEYETKIIGIDEHAYLMTPDKTVIIKYNPEISGLKQNYVDTITPTLGSAYPFIRRAG